MTVIRTTRFDSARERRAKLAREYDEGMRELNARYPAQLPQTRGPDPIGEEITAAGFIVSALVVAIFVIAVLS